MSGTWSNQRVDLIVLQEDVSGWSGIFGYSPSIGAGNLIFSVAAAAGVDPYGNAYPAGLSLTGSSGVITAGQITASSISASSIGGSTITGSDFQGGTMEETTITFDSGGGRLLLYVTTTTTTTYTSGSGNFSVPAGITSLKVQCWGGAQAGYSHTGSGNGGGGGEFAQESALAVTGGGSCAYSVGAGGASAAAAGHASTFAGTSVTVTAHGGTGGLGGSGSANSIHFNGGNGGAGGISPGSAGGGGGSSAGTSAAGANGASNSGATGGAGGTAPSGGGNGGAGGAGSSGNGTAGSAPGGAGGGAGIFSTGAGAAGAAGKIVVSYVSANTLIGSFAPVSGTDPLGNAYPAGAMTNVLTLPNNGSPPASASGEAQAFGSSGHLDYISSDGTTYDTGRLTLSVQAQTISSTSATPLTGISAAVAAATYRVKAWIMFHGGSSAGTAVFAFTGPGGTTGTLSAVFTLPAGTITESASQTFTNAFTSQTLNSASFQRLDLDAILTFGGTGTLALTVKEGTSLDTVVMVGGVVELYPVVA